MGTILGQEAFRKWVSASGIWADYVRPVPFVIEDEFASTFVHSSAPARKAAASTNTSQGAGLGLTLRPDRNLAVIVDLPGTMSVEYGVELARLGFCPVPIYNSPLEPIGVLSTVDSRSLSKALIEQADKVFSIEIKRDSMPAFLIDENRSGIRKKDVNAFDNAWDVYGQDLPSAKFMREHGVQGVAVLVQEIKWPLYRSVNADLRKVLYALQKKKMPIYITDGFGEMRRIKLCKLIVGRED